MLSKSDRTSLLPEGELSSIRVADDRFKSGHSFKLFSAPAIRQMETLQSEIVNLEEGIKLIESVLKRTENNAIKLKKRRHAFIGLVLIIVCLACPPLVTFAILQCIIFKNRRDELGQQFNEVRGPNQETCSHPISCNESRSNVRHMVAPTLQKSTPADFADLCSSLDTQYCKTNFYEAGYIVLALAGTLMLFALIVKLRNRQSPEPDFSIQYRMLSTSLLAAERMELTGLRLGLDIEKDSFASGLTKLKEAKEKRQMHVNIALTFYNTFSPSVIEEIASYTDKYQP